MAKILPIATTHLGHASYHFGIALQNSLLCSMRSPSVFAA